MQIKHDPVTVNVERIKADLIRWRRHLHRHPELSFQERETSAYVRQELEKMDAFDFETNVGGYGIIATLTGREGPTVGLRADMDALPINEHNDLDYQSVHPGVMHACGHDAHTAILLGTAKLLSEESKAGKLAGTIKFIFQPAEEDTNEAGMTGAPLMLKSGLLDDIEAFLALHVCPWRPTGEIQVNDGPSMANIDNFRMTIKATGGHGGYPHLATDPIWMSSYFLQALYSLISRKVDPLSVGAISVGEIHGGETANVIPDEVTITGTMRSYTKAMRAQLVRELEQIAGVIPPLGGSYDLYIETGEPALDNDKIVNEQIKAAAKHLYPNMKIHEGPFGMGGEDFAHMIDNKPGAMFFLGCAQKGAPERKLHTGDFQIDENALPIGAAILTNCIHRLLQVQEGRKVDD
ncbi:amidohydrolase [Thalassobacillus cyri]|uniref:Amidohydrolase n=1 Tax=Thalassobacillus cyri TaxID=571932 RepID=A0A1H3ZAR2_9BACI|nr:amidohydrolase [Thalassobacillus cyri]SEA20588.1 amidohydrolase [Thalassobacillus cyri]